MQRASALYGSRIVPDGKLRVCQLNRELCLLISFKKLYKKLICCFIQGCIQLPRKQQRFFLRGKGAEQLTTSRFNGGIDHDRNNRPYGLRQQTPGMEKTTGKNALLNTFQITTQNRNFPRTSSGFFHFIFDIGCEFHNSETSFVIRIPFSHDRPWIPTGIAGIGKEREKKDGVC